MALKFLRSLDADDIFLSYSRLDGSAYVTGLDAALSAQGFACFSDTLGTDANLLLPETLRQKIRLCKTLVLLATPGAFTRPENIADEVSEFAAANGTARIVCVSFDRGEASSYWSDAVPWHAHVAGKRREREEPAALKTGEPSGSIVKAVAAASNYMKSKDRLRMYRNRALVGLLFLLAVSVVAGGFASYQAGQAAQAMTEAKKQGNIAESRSLANRSQTLLRQRPEDVPGVLRLAMNAMEKSLAAGMHGVEADGALRDSLALLPLLRNSYPYAAAGDRPSELAFSPDGQHFAMLVADNTLRIYETAGQKPFKERTPLYELSCACSAVALSSGLVHAAGVTDGGVKLFDLKNDAKSRLVKLEGDVSVSKIALTPGGRYLALSVDDGEDVGRFSNLFVVDSTDSSIVKKLDNLNMVINDIAFGHNDLLAVGGKAAGAQGYGRVLLWSLPLTASDGAEPELTEGAFFSPESATLPKEVQAVAPGTGINAFATDGGMWKRPSDAMDYKIVARFPYVRDFPSRASVNKLAFAPDGRVLVLARSIDARDQNQNESDQSVLETWGMPGHADVGHVFLSHEITKLGFKPAEALVVTMTDEGGDEEAIQAFAVTGEEAEGISFDPKLAERPRKYASPDASHVMDIDDGRITVWDVWGKRQLSVPFDGAVDDIKAASIGATGNFLALAGSKEGGARFLVVYGKEGDVYREKKRIPQTADDLQSPGAMSLSADGKRLAVIYSYADQFVRVWDVDAGTDISPTDLANASEVNLMMLSPNGRFLVLSDLDEQTRLLDLSPGKDAKMVSLLEDMAIAKLAFSSDGRFLGLGGDDGTLHLFNTAQPEGRIASLSHTGRITAIAFSDDGKYMATASSNPHAYRIEEEESYPMRVWYLEPADLIAEARRRLAPFLTDEKAARPPA